jgi:putative membrane-bound dehydrogenase-like protein
MKRNLWLLAALGALSWFMTVPNPLLPQQAKTPIPHGQSAMPGPPLTPQEALKKMVVPEGFRVELVAAEPTLINPVAMCFDEKGRIWVTESIEYPRRSPGPGKDRVKVLESSKGDGNYDKTTVVIEGLNIPSGIAVGHGGVWVANSPDILFYPFLDPDRRDLRMGKPEVVVSGFGRSDTHELPNSLTWGPDGWLYGLNGVFNPSHIKYRDKEFNFTCAMFRIHPHTKEFEVFCEGTSNPWGIAFDGEGSAFVSACVIDHLWHLVQTGYYHRQGGPYPPYTWKIESIVQHKHQKAAYCGLCWFDSDAYPPEYRRKLYMGNIHGNCINSDELTRSGSTYFARPRPDFLTANDAWFMPVAQKVGPDGLLYLLDWYDRYHCYQDAERDPGGIDRLNGRLYRIRYKDSAPAAAFDLGAESDDKLIQYLGDANIFYRDTAQRLLTERLLKAEAKTRQATADKLADLASNVKSPRKARLHALWSLIGAGPLPSQLHLRLAEEDDPTFRAWAVRAAGNARKVDETVLKRLLGLTQDKYPDVLLQWAIAATKVEGVEPMPVMLSALWYGQNDRLIPHIVWQNLHPLLESQSNKFIAAVSSGPRDPNLASILPRAVDRMLALPKTDPGVFASLLQTLLKNNENATVAKIMNVLADRARTGEIGAADLPAFRKALQPLLAEALQMSDVTATHRAAAVLAVSVKEGSASGAARKLFLNNEVPDNDRIRALDGLIFTGDAAVRDLVATALTGPARFKPSLRAQVIAVLGRSDADWVPKLTLAALDKQEPEVRARIVDVLTQRPAWSKELLQEIGAKKLPPAVLNINQVRRLQGSKDGEVAALVLKYWGTVRDERSPEREKVVMQMKKLLSEKRGDPFAGKAVFTKHCGVCHKIHGEGQDLGPDITSNGRNDFEQLLSNVFDPSLVIGVGFQATSVVTKTGQVLQGLLVEDNLQRVVLKLQGGEMKTIARSDVDSVKQSKVSFMPEQFENQMTPQELRDLFAFLTLDRAPGDPTAKLIPGTPR